MRRRLCAGLLGIVSLLATLGGGVLVARGGVATESVPAVGSLPVLLLIGCVVATTALVVVLVMHLLSRRAFYRSTQELVQWIRAARGPIPPALPTASLLKPVAREVAKLSARLRAARETVREISAEESERHLWTAARLKAHVVTLLGRRPLLIVSNREPYLHVKERGHRTVMTPASGLVTALDPIARATSGIWIAHGSGNADREVVDEEQKLLVPPEAPVYTLKRVWLTKEEEEGFYYGFSNEALWPLCHQTHHRPYFVDEEWQAYRQVNEKFADAIVAECGSEPPYILIQDYHFTLLPQLIRARRPDAVVGLFWHIPWPHLEAFQICPWKREILEGMLGAHLLGFHIQSYCHNFLDTVNTLLPVRIDWDRFAVLHAQGATVVKPFPISVEPWGERHVADEATAQQAMQELRAQYELGDQRLIVSVDRLDYTKGIPERLMAIETFLERYPQYRGQVCFIALGAPSRVHIPRYRELMSEVERLADRINWTYGQEGWRPVLLLKANHTPQTVYLFLRLAEACIVSALADGMNLVAKEFVAARTADDGVLILSEFTGVAREFQEAVPVNPYARSDFAEAIRIALEMPPEERRRWMQRLRQQVTEHNVYRWAADQLTELTQATRQMDAAMAADALAANQS